MELTYSLQKNIRLVVNISDEYLVNRKFLDKRNVKVVCYYNGKRGRPATKPLLGTYPNCYFLWNKKRIYIEQYDCLSPKEFIKLIEDDIPLNKCAIWRFLQRYKDDVEFVDFFKYTPMFISSHESSGTITKANIFSVQFSWYGWKINVVPEYETMTIQCMPNLYTLEEFTEKINKKDISIILKTKKESLFTKIRKRLKGDRNYE